ncbi:hypothetical protein PLICRDRAFT_163256 [Plicaturopsis crispa FD-325 SS-3]|nr:hypothetical protein PLICRDRAFT_163256 [Plicaturopsis crispa FD-325 SS-3]
MYWYISFLRPPPCRASVGAPVVCTPQIANDLRTELYPEPQSIFYKWILLSPEPERANRPKPYKLTTWRPEDAFKELKVPPPKRALHGEMWRLILSATPEVLKTVDLVGTQDVPFPVMSLPIEFSGEGARSTEKQDGLQRLYALPQGLLMAVQEKTAFDLDKKVWDSGIGLSAWLVNLLRSTPDFEAGLRRDLLINLTGFTQCRCLELGSGTGIVSMTLAAMLSNSETLLETTTTVVATDLASAMPVLKRNLLINKALFSQVKICAAVLDWEAHLAGEKAPLPKCVRAMKSVDIIFMADVTYNTAAFPALMATLKRINTWARDKPMIVLGYKERDPDERTFWEMAREIGVKFERVGTQEGMGEEPVEIYIALGTALDKGPLKRRKSV